MTDFHVFFDEWGLLAVFLIGFAEFIGFPVAGIPLMLAAGSLAATQGFSFIPVVLTAAAGAWVADAIWFRRATQDAARVIDIACGLASNPRVCVTHVQRRMLQAGPVFVVSAKLIPGVGNMSAAAAGLAEMSPAVFLPVNAAAAVLWAGAFMGAGWVFSSYIDQAIGLIAVYGQQSAIAAVALIVVATIWRVYKVRLHTGLHVREGKGR